MLSVFKTQLPHKQELLWKAEEVSFTSYLVTKTNISNNNPQEKCHLFKTKVIFL